MSQELSAKPAASVAVQNSNALNAQDMMGALAEMSRDPSVPAEKLIALGEFQLKIYDRAREEEFNKDLNKALDDMPIITKDGKIQNRGTYSTFERLMSAVKPVLKANRLRIRFDQKSNGGAPEIASILTHDNGLEKISGYLSVPASAPNNSVKPAEAAMMAVTRGKRHVLKSTLGIVEQDDDGFGKHYHVVAIEREDWQVDLEATAMKKAMQGMAEYSAWYKSESAMHRGFLVDYGVHAKCKTAANQADNPSANHGDFPGDR